MSDENAQPPTPPRTITLSSDPDELSAQAKVAHLYTVGGIIIGAIADAKGFLKMPDTRTASTLGEWLLNELIRSIKPRDAVEEMLVIQMAFVHQRIGNLSLQASEQVLTKNVAVINQALDGACNVYRRQMLALAEYRRATQPKLSHSSLQASGDPQHEIPTNEQGSASVEASSIPAFSGGIGVPACVGAATSAVGGQHGSANGSGQVALKAQRAQTRSVLPGPALRTAANKRVDPATARRRRML